MAGVRSHYEPQATKDAPVIDQRLNSHAEVILQHAHGTIPCHVCATHTEAAISCCQCCVQVSRKGHAGDEGDMCPLPHHNPKAKCTACLLVTYRSRFRSLSITVLNICPAHYNAQHEHSRAGCHHLALAMVVKLTHCCPLPCCSLSSLACSIAGVFPWLESLSVLRRARSESWDTPDTHPN